LQGICQAGGLPPPAPPCQPILPRRLELRFTLWSESPSLPAIPKTKRFPLPPGCPQSVRSHTCPLITFHEPIQLSRHASSDARALQAGPQTNESSGPCAACLNHRWIIPRWSLQRFFFDHFCHFCR
jgi:hypothetical protein